MTTVYQQMLAEKLSERQRRILAAYARDGSVQLAAYGLGISPQTFKNTLSGAYRRLHVDGAIEAFRAVGWLVPPESGR
jgi:DNA-binding CsgD family transcriptional regulator